MKPVIIDTTAEVEFADAVAFYEARQPGLGLDFEAAVRKAVRAIQEHPERFGRRKGTSQRLIMRRFPFIIHFTVLPDAIWVLAFAHTSRRPGFWRGRGPQQ